MGCGCADRCTCSIVGAGGLTVTGSGDVGNPYVLTQGAETVFDASSSDNSIEVIPGGTNGHEPILNVRIDPASTAPVSVSGAGLRIDCCGGAAVNYATSTIVLDYAADLSTDHTLLVDASGGPIAIDLPSMHSLGDELIVMDKAGISGTNNITVASLDGDLINGGADYVISTAYESITLRSDGLNWYII